MLNNSLELARDYIIKERFRGELLACIDKQIAGAEQQKLVTTVWHLQQLRELVLNHDKDDGSDVRREQQEKQRVDWTKV